MKKTSITLSLGLFLAIPGFAGAATVTLDWLANSESDLAGYRVYSATGPLTGMTTAQAFASPTVIKTVVAAPAVTRVMTGLLDGTSYFFKLTAFDNAASPNESDFNVDAVSGLPVEVTTFTVLPAPTGLSAAAGSATSVNLAWTDASNSETGFVVERSPNGTTGFAQVGSTGAGVAVFTDAALSPSSQYFYRVRAAKGAVQSQNSNVASATTSADVTPPARPRGFGVR